MAIFKFKETYNRAKDALGKYIEEQKQGQSLLSSHSQNRGSANNVSLKQWINEVPSAAKKVGNSIYKFSRDAFQQSNQGILSVGMQISGEKERDLSLGGPVQRKLLGTEGTIKKFSTRVRENTESTRNVLPDKYKKYAGPLAGAGTILSTGMDIVPGVGPARKKAGQEALELLVKRMGKEAAEKVAKEGGEKAVVRTLAALERETASSALHYVSPDGKSDVFTRVTKKELESLRDEVKNIKFGGGKGNIHLSPVEKLSGKIPEVSPDEFAKLAPNAQATLKKLQNRGRYVKGPDGKFAGSAPGKERKFIASVKVADAVAPEVKAAVQGTYEPITNAETMNRAMQLVESSPDQAMLKLVEGKMDADYTATALALINKAQTSGDFTTAAKIVEDAAKKLTQGGQFIQAASMLNKMTPEGWLVYAGRRLGKKKAKLTPQLVEKITKKAEDLANTPPGYDKIKKTQDLTEEITRAIPRSKWDVTKGWALELANMPRTIMSSFFDFSFGLRQGLYAGFRHPKEFGKAFGKQFTAFRSEKGYDQVMDMVVKHPDFNLAQESRLAISDINAKLGGREERYMSSFAEKLPLLGIPIRATNRAYTAMANKLRMDTFAKLIQSAEDAGLKPRQNQELAHSIANLVNDITGRGNMNQAFERAAPLLNAFFYSPRLMASRMHLLNPIRYAKQPAPVRKEYIKTMLSAGAGIGSIIGLASLHPDVSVETDMRSADWGKIKIGNTRVDIMGGMQQYIRIASQVISGKYVSSSTGKIVTLGEGYRPLTRKEILLRGIESKEAPIFSFLTSVLTGQDGAGEKISVPKEIGERFVPMLVSDIWELYKEDPSLLPLGFLGTLGVGLQSYPPPPAYEKLNELNSLPKDQQAQAFEQLKKDNPKLAEQVKTAKLQENFTEFDWGLTYMGVENGRRAQFLVEHFKNLPENERAAAWEDLKYKRLISQRVSEQIQYLMENPDFKVE